MPDPRFRPPPSTPLLPSPSRGIPSFFPGKLASSRARSIFPLSRSFFLHSREAGRALHARSARERTFNFGVAETDRNVSSFQVSGIRRKFPRRVLHLPPITVRSRFLLFSRSLALFSLLPSLFSISALGLRRCENRINCHYWRNRWIFQSPD